MAGIVKTHLQLGDSSTPTSNFMLTAQAADGTMKLARGNNGLTTQDILTVDSLGNLVMPSGGLTVANNLNIPSINSGQIGGHRNFIINGDMQVSQVNGANVVSPLGGSTYVVDQWRYYTTQAANKISFQQVVDAPAGFKYSIKATVTNQYAPAAADQFTFSQPIEGQNLIPLGFGTATPRTVAFSCWIKGSVAGTYTVWVANGASTRCYVGTIAVSTAWTNQTVILVADSLTTAVWATDNTCGMQIGFDLGSGTSMNAAATNTWGAAATRTSGAVTFVNQVAGSTLNITGVQLEKVSTNATKGTDFEFVSYADQLRWCQRYLPCWNSINTIGHLGGSSCFTYTATIVETVITFPVPTRTGVTGVVVSSPSHLAFANGTSSGIGTSVTMQYTSTSAAAFVSGVTGSYGVSQAGWLYFNTAAGQLYFTGAQL